MANTLLKRSVLEPSGSKNPTRATLPREIKITRIARTPSTTAEIKSNRTVFFFVNFQLVTIFFVKGWSVRI